ncbi:hypothetical protein [Streptomyces sp. V4I2]|uniref:hypothetical protein n=1 Tax=Streptomyces sp. V4I2 TaxID=3042280 RepID=UPI0027830840|nr:hypothetical protein [Streptomyces sp. V4I2]MDQ1047351.1 hypothetical protein [Streptomyces sp. V4I2]
MDTHAEPVPEEWRGTRVWSRAPALSGTVPFAGSPAALPAWWTATSRMLAGY